MGVKRLWNSLATGLSARLLVLTVFFVMLSEVLIFVLRLTRPAR